MVVLVVEVVVVVECTVRPPEIAESPVRSACTSYVTSIRVSWLANRN